MKQELHLPVMYNRSRDGDAGSCFLSARRAAPAVLVQGPVAASVSLSRGINTAALQPHSFLHVYALFGFSSSRASLGFRILALGSFGLFRFYLLFSIVQYDDTYQILSGIATFSKLRREQLQLFNSSANIDTEISSHLPVGLSAFEVLFWCFSLKFPHSTTAAEQPSLTSRHQTKCASNTSTPLFCPQS